jgi:hypothetical protein
VTRETTALEVEPGVFTIEDPREVARSLLRSASRSARAKHAPFRAAMAKLVFYLNRTGRKLEKSRRATLEQVKVELRALCAAEDRQVIRKLPKGGYRLLSRKKDPKTGKRRNLGTFKTRAAAEKHERAVQFFKRSH